MAHVGNREINNIDCEIHASQHGRWTIYRAPEQEDEPANERYLAADEDFNKAVNAARVEIKKQQVKVAVPFKTVDGKSGIAHGRHARSRSKILTKINGKSEQVDYHAQTLKHDTPTDVIDHLRELRQEQVKLRREERELVKKWSLDLGIAVDTAVQEAIKEQS